MDVRGYKVARVLVEQAADIAQELYLGITVDRDRQANVVILSAAGGMDIEEIAERHPEKVPKRWRNGGLGRRDLHIRPLAVQAGVGPELLKQLAPTRKTGHQTR